MEDTKNKKIEISKSAPLFFQDSTETGEIEDLYSYLYKDEPGVYDKSKDNLDNLIQLHKRSSMVSFIGAGTSKPLAISDWKELMKNLWNKAKGNGFSSDFPENSKEWPNLAQKIFDYLENIGQRRIYFNTISQSMSPKNNTTTLTLIKLVLALDMHLTTNFDISIENAYKFLAYLANQFEIDRISKKYQVYYLPDFRIFQGIDNQGTIYYLHGSTERDVYILKKNDYDTFYPSVSNLTNSVNSSLEDFLKVCYKERNIVFLGFSFDDRYVRKYFFKLAEETQMASLAAEKFYNQSGQPYETETIYHFLIIDAKILKKRPDVVNLFEKKNIYMIVYKTGEHIFLEKLFETLSKGRNI